MAASDDRNHNAWLKFKFWNQQAHMVPQGSQILSILIEG